MKLVIDASKDILRAPGFKAGCHFMDAYTSRDSVQEAAYIQPSKVGEVISHVIFEEGIVYVKVFQDGTESIKMRDRADLASGDFILHDFDRGSRW